MEDMENLRDLAYSEYNKVDKTIKKDLFKALNYAKDKINSIEGPLKNKEYIINIISGFDDMMICLIYTEDQSFTHYGSRHDDGAEAVVRATCEYTNGFNNPNLPY